jgi:hypothetical protein
LAWQVPLLVALDPAEALVRPQGVRWVAVQSACRVELVPGVGHLVWWAGRARAAEGRSVGYAMWRQREMVTRALMCWGLPMGLCGANQVTHPVRQAGCPALWASQLMARARARARPMDGAEL